MTKTKSFLTVFTVVAALTAAYFIWTIMKAPQLEPLNVESKTGVHRFMVEVAATREQQEVGLMFRKQMPPDQGMLFQMGQAGVVRFWMKNTLIPLDMIFITRDGVIRKIHANAKPHDLSPISSGMPVVAVLELNGGKAKELGIAVGDKVIHPYFKTSSPGK